MKAGMSIVHSGELVEQIWMQVVEMSDARSAMTETALKNNEFANLRSAGIAKVKYETSDSGRVDMSYSISFPVMRKTRRKSVPSAWLNYQVSVFGGGIPQDQDGTKSVGPVVHVSFWHDSTDFTYKGLYVEFPPAWDDCGIEDGRLLVWKGKETDEFPQWTFSIRLLDLNNEDALRKSIIEPVKALLARAQAATALPTGLPGLVFYTSEDQSIPGWNLIARASQ